MFSTIASLSREIQNYEVSKAVCAALGLEAQVPQLEENIRSRKSKPMLIAIIAMKLTAYIRSTGI